MTVQVVTNPWELSQRFPRKRDSLLGLVPTMGALHEGHTSLIQLARRECQAVVVSIFVNPLQFGPREDFSRYPRPLESDLQKCQEAGVDVVFTPTPELMYPKNYSTAVEVAGLQDGLCGASRPGHFRGVATVVLKLFNLVQPDRAYFGQKDAQQVRIIQQMVQDLNVPVEIRVGQTVRAQDGLALSSRNQYLDADQRRQAPVLYRVLQEATAQIQGGTKDARTIRDQMVKTLAETPGAGVDYVALVDADSLKPVTHLQGKVLLALAVRFGTTRLIDNAIVDVRSRTE